MSSGLEVTFEGLRKFLPLLHQTLHIALLAGKFLGLTLGFFGTDEALKLRFTESNRGFSACDLFFDFVQAVFHLLALDGVQTAGFGVGWFGLESVAVGGCLGRGT